MCCVSCDNTFFLGVSRGMDTRVHEIFYGSTPISRTMYECVHKYADYILGSHAKTTVCCFSMLKKCVAHFPAGLISMFVS